MGICLHHIETIVRGQALISSLYVVKKGDRRKIYRVMDSPIHGEHNDASCNSIDLYCIVYVSYSHFCRCL